MKDIKEINAYQKLDMYNWGLISPADITGDDFREALFAFNRDIFNHVRRFQHEYSPRDSIGQLIIRCGSLGF